jgi:choice-of-anchor B domain-containing protein
MKNYILPILLFAVSILSAQTPCVGGMAAGYPCNGYDLQSHIPLSTMNTSGANDSWGWTDPSDGKEYALVGLEDGTAFIDISDPINPIYLGKLPTHTSSIVWRDVKTYNNYAFIVSEASDHGMQIFDLSQLSSVVSPPVTFTEDAHYSGFSNAHNIVINEDTGYAYAVGTNTYSGGSHFVNIQDPLNPVAAGGYSADGYTHDAQVVIYNGPDPDYAGHEILISSSGNVQAVSIVDVTDKANPVGITTIGYSNSGYTHQGWFTEDQRYFLLGDEFDEADVGFNTRTIIFDFIDLDNPQWHFDFFGTTAAIDHNGYVKGNEYYLANYSAGMRVMDISDIANFNMPEIAFFDSYPSNNNANYEGVWNVFPYFGSGNILITDRSGGFFLVKASLIDTTDPIALCQNITVSLAANGQIIVDPADVDNGSSDNSGFFTLQLDQNSFDCSGLGSNTVVLTVTDPSGNTDTCNAVVTVVDDLAPQLSCPANSSVSYDSGASYYTLPDYVANNDVTGMDNCLSPIVISQDPGAGTQLTYGTYTISFNSTDPEGNLGSCTFGLTVDQSLGLAENEFTNSFVLYPNPATNVIQVAAKNSVLNSIVIHDIAGKRLYSEVDLKAESTSIDISAYSNGLYFITINDAFTKKIIKQ